MYFYLFAPRLSSPRQPDVLEAYQSAAQDITSGFGAVANLWMTAVQAQMIYAHDQWSEWMGLSVPLREPTNHFSIAHNVQAGKIPPTKVTSEVLADFPFCRVWSFDRTEKTPNDPTFLIVAPYSGTDVRIMSDAVTAFLPIGNVRLIEQRDRHRVPFYHTNGLDDSTGALIEVARRNPNCHMIGFSQSGVPATVATAWMYQNPAFKGREPASLTVIGSPINAQLAPSTINKMAASTISDPPYVMVGPYFAGAGCFVCRALSQSFACREKSSPGKCAVRRAINPSPQNIFTTR